MTITKSHTTFHALAAEKFNEHDETGDGVLWLGPVLFDGAIVTIGGYKIRYSGIIVSSDEIVTHDTTGFQYVCLLGVNTTEGADPYTVATNVKQGICLIEKYKEGWITRDNKFKGDFRGLPFTRVSDATGTVFHACYGPGVCGDGTIVHAPIKLPFSMDAASGTTIYPGVSDIYDSDGSTVIATVVTGYAHDGHLVINSDLNIAAIPPTIDLYIRNNALGTIDTVAGVGGSVLAIIEKTSTHCVFAYVSGSDLIVGENEYGVGPGATTTYTFSANISKVDFVTPTTVVAQLVDNTFVYGMLMPASVDVLFSGSSRWFHVDHKNSDFVHIGTDDKLYLNTVEIGSTTNFALTFDGKIIQVDSTGHIIDGGKTTGTGYTVTDIISSRTPSDELFLLFVNAGGIDAVSYNPILCETSFSYPVGAGASVGAVSFANNLTLIYLGSEECTYRQPVSAGAIPDQQEAVIVPSENVNIRFGRKRFQLDNDYSKGDFYIKSNTTGTFSGVVDTVWVGEVRTHTVTDVSMMPLIVGAAVSDGDMLESTDIGTGEHGYTKSIAIDIVGVPSALMPVFPAVGTIAAGPVRSISSGIAVSGGSCDVLNVNAANSTISGMTIADLEINIAKNVLFIGCDIAIYNDTAVLPDVNTFKFIGCTIGGIPANTFLALTDTPAAYTGEIGKFVVVNAAENAVEFTDLIFTDEASYAAAGPVWGVTYISSDYASFSDQIVTCTVDVVGTVTEITYPDVIHVHGASLKDMFHRSITFSFIEDAGVTIIAQDGTIYYEDACFIQARLNPLTDLNGAGNDYVEVHTDGTVLVRGINFSSPTSSTVRYAVRFSYNKVSHVP